MIVVDKEPDVHVTEAELRRYTNEYRKAYMFYAGTPPTLEEFIRRKKNAKDMWRGR